MDDRKSRIAELREKKRFRERSLDVVRNDSGEESTTGHRKRWSISESVPVTPEPDYHQSRDYEKSPPFDPPSELDRIDPPSYEIKPSFRELMATATDAWIQSHASTNSATSQDDTTVYASNIDSRSRPRSRRSRKKRSVAFKKNLPYQEDLTRQREPEEILSVEPEHGNYRLSVPVPDPPGDNPKFDYPSDDQSMDSMKGHHDVKDIQDEDDSTIHDDLQPALVSSIASIESHADTIDSAKDMAPFLQPNSKESTPTKITDTTAISAGTATTTTATLKLSPTTASISSIAITQAKKKSLEGLDGVFVQDQLYSWIPAKVLDYEQEHAIVAIDLPDSWYETTILEHEKSSEDAHPSMKSVPLEEQKRYMSKFGIPLQDLRKVPYNEFDNHDLPLQNQGEGKMDMADLVELHFPAILYNLKARHHQQKPYTRVGDIVIAMNPCSWIEELYDPKTRDAYSSKLIWEARHGTESEICDDTKLKNNYERLGFEPHVYEVSALAYRGLATTGQDQAILVTGESGAGKTETVKIVMNHLATVQQTRPGGLPTEHCTAKEIVARVLRSSPVFEAFGNAKTVRNHNSSRFGKFTQMQFQLEPRSIADLAGRDIPFTDLVGSKCTTYLLEKSRVVNHDAGERSFHIFYQLLAAPTEFKRNLWPTLAYRTAHHYSFTSGEIGNVTVDAAAWEDTIAALRVFRFEEESLQTLLRAMIIVLQLGNLIFDRDPTKPSEDITIIKNKAELVELSQLMGIDKDVLQESLTSRSLKTPGGHEDIKVKLLPQNAKESCDALAKEIYAKMFDVLVQKINNYTAFPETLLANDVKCGHISLLDIFGFERFATNRFEQLCINYANERLHNKYVVDNFNDVKDEYLAEGVDLYDFKLVDNSEIIALLEGNSGILATLDEECVRPKGNAGAFVYKAKLAHKDSTKLIDDRLHRKWEFGIKHFAGAVEYDAQNFLSRNADRLPEGLIECASKSQNSLIGDAFKLLLSDTGKKSLETNQNRKRPTNSTVLQKFQSQLKSLMTFMQGTKTRYIRCIKPNEDMIPRKINHRGIMQQLECSGLMTALIISRESFPNKLSYEFIMKRYACLMNSEVFAETMTLQEKVLLMLQNRLMPLSKISRNGLQRLPFVCGTTKVFFKAGAQDALEQFRFQHYESATIRIQSTVRRIDANRQIEHMKISVSVIQSFVRMALVCWRLKRQHSASTKISSWIRSRQAVMLRAELNKAKAATLIQAFARRNPIRREFMTKNAAVRVLQKSMRQFKDSATLRAELKSLTKQALMDSKVSFLSKKVESEKVMHTSRSKKLFSEFQEMYGHLWEEIKSLRSENDELRTKLASSDAERRILEIQKERSDATVSTYHSRIKGLLKANDALVKEVEATRLEASGATRKVHENQRELEAKLSKAEKELERVKSMHQKRLEELENEVKESQAQNKEVQRRLEKEILRRKEKQENEKKKIEEELNAAKKSHQQQMTKLIDVLDNGQSKRQEEMTKLTAELLSMRKAKDEQISRLQQEVNALRASNGASPRNIRAALEPHSLCKQLTSDAELRSRRVAEFDDIYQSLQSLITESSVLPRYVSARDMETVVKQQERGQKMYEMLESLGYLFKNEEASQHSTSATALSLIEKYMASTRPNRTILDLNDRLMEADLQICRLREELRDKEYCKRCAVRDSSTQRRRQFMGSSPE